MKKIILFLLIIINIITPVMSEPYVMPKLDHSSIYYDGSWQELLENLNNTIDIAEALPGEWEMKFAITIDVPVPLNIVTWDLREKYQSGSKVVALIVNDNTSYNLLIEGEIDYQRNRVIFDFSQVAPEINYLFIFEKI